MSSKANLSHLTRSSISSSSTVALLSVGIGVTLLVGRVIWGVVYAPLAFPNSEQLVLVSQEAPGADVRLDRVPLSEAGYVHYRDNAASFSDFAAFYSRDVGVGLEDGARLLDSARATSNLADVLGIAPSEGRWFSASETKDGGAPVAVVSRRLAQESFGRLSPVGKSIEIDGTATTIVGVMPPSFSFPWEDTALWTPLIIDESAPDSGNHWLRGVARLEPGRTKEEAEVELESLIPSLSELYPDVYSPTVLESWDFGVVARGLQSEITREIEPMLFLALFAGLLIFSVCCASASLHCLAGFHARSRELSLRAMLGASSRQLVIRASARPVALAIISGFLATAGVVWASPWLESHQLPTRIPRLGTALDSLGTWTLAVPLVAVALIVTTAPVAHAAIARSRTSGLDSSVGQRPGITVLTLVGAQVGLVVLLVVGSSLLLQTGRNLERTELGLYTENRLSFGIALTDSRYPDPPARARFEELLAERLASLPGVVDVGSSSSAPLTRGRNAMRYQIELEQGLTEPEAIDTRLVSANLFSVVGPAVLTGRPFDDTEAGSQEAVVSVALVERYFSGDTVRALGQSLALGDNRFEIVGIVGDTRDVATGLVREPMVYLRNGFWDRQFWMTLASATEIETLKGPVRQAVKDLDPALPIEGLSSLEESVTQARWRTRLLTLLIGYGCLLAIATAVIGLAATASQAVVRGLKTSAIRLAVGAQVPEALMAAVSGCIVAAAVGSLAGLGLGVALGRLLRAELFGVGLVDPLSIGAGILACGLVLTVALLFASRPLRRSEISGLLRAE